MSTYIKDFDWEEYQDEESLEKYYEELEEQEKLKKQKRQTKLREYEGYGE